MVAYAEVQGQAASIRPVVPGPLPSQGKFAADYVRAPCCAILRRLNLQ
jgi:hypothetical protein